MKPTSTGPSSTPKALPKPGSSRSAFKAVAASRRTSRPTLKRQHAKRSWSLDGEASSGSDGDGTDVEEPPAEPGFIPEHVFKDYYEFQHCGGENALMFFVHHPEHDEWGPWIMAPGNYAKALEKYIPSSERK